MINDHSHPHEHEHVDHEHQREGTQETAHNHKDNHSGEHGQATHSHVSGPGMLDPALSTQQGIRTVKVSLVVLLVTALFQVVVVFSSGSVALLADTIHNFSDALTAIPLWLAFNLSRRLRNTRYTYGYGRAEDLAGAVIVTLIFISAIEVFHQSVRKMIQPVPVSNLGWVAAAAVIGFLGNELAAILRMRTGRAIHSAALVADGRHSQVDGFTSLGVLAGVAGIKLGWPLADPLVGFVIGTTILLVAWSSAREIWYRLMDATDPEVTRLINQTAAIVPGVMRVEDIRIRWLGHWQHCELHIMVDENLPTSESHQIAEAVRHALFHTLPTLQEISVHVDPCEDQPGSEHVLTAHHTGST
jgi:cation diffusion facilitator family transporter